MSNAVIVYLPRDGAAGLWGHTVLPGSAIVGRREDDQLTDRVHVYYEGNRYGATNMVTFADRAMHAYWRMRENYPTVAQAAAPAAGLEPVGTLDPNTGVITLIDGMQATVAEWLDLPLDALADQLHRTGVHS